MQLKREREIMEQCRQHISPLWNIWAFSTATYFSRGFPCPPLTALWMLPCSIYGNPRPVGACMCVCVLHPDQLPMNNPIKWGTEGGERGDEPMGKGPFRTAVWSRSIKRFEYFLWELDDRNLDSFVFPLTYMRFFF